MHSLYKSTSSLTQLTCQDGKKAAKTFVVNANKEIEKMPIRIGKKFTWKEIPVYCLADLAAYHEKALNEPKSFPIRGKPIEGIPKIAVRKSSGPEATFKSCPRPYVMIDVDHMALPDFINVVANPEQALLWVVKQLPKAFQDVSFYYQFSSSQNVPKKLNDKPESTISAHIWFWLNRDVSDSELKRYFKKYAPFVDTALFNPVQPHFSARPNFKGMSDPLKERSGVVKGSSDVVILDEMPTPLAKKALPRSENEPVVSPEDEEEAIKRLLPYYKEGKRDKLCATIASIVYRKGWSAENASNFVYKLAKAANDDEAEARQKGALRLCDSIDAGGIAPGIPTLKDEFGVEDVEGLLSLLGVGKPDIDAAINTLNSKSGLDQIKPVIEMLLSLSSAEQKVCIDQIKQATGFSKPALNELLKEATVKLPLVDMIGSLAQGFILSAKVQDGRLLFYSKKQYWLYNGRYWQPVSDEFVEGMVLDYLTDFIAQNEGKYSSVNLLKGVMTLLRALLNKEENPIHLKVFAPSVINCRNAELWFDDKGNVEPKPHTPEHYLQHCIDVDYDPHATSPMFDEALLEIFANSKDPKGMARHSKELAGYICQPWRKHAKVVLFHGHGRNGKSSLMSLIQNVIGINMVLAEKINNLDRNPFIIGALDGKLLFVDDDVDCGTTLSDGLMKKISERKLLTGEHKHKPSYQFMSNVLPVMLSNTFPALKDLSVGIRERLMAIPFTRKFERTEIKHDLFDEIWTKEASGVLNQFIAGFKRLRKRGDFDEPVDCIEATQEWISRSNILPQFISECCEHDVSFSQSLGDFYAVYKQYCYDNGSKHILTQHNLAQRLESLGYTIVLKGKKKYVRGIRAVNQDFETHQEVAKPKI